MMIKALLDRARAAPAGSRVVVLDVGANNGDWSRIEWPGIAAELRAAGKRFELYIVEPQPQFAQPLQKLADGNGFTFVPAAAWKANTTLYFDVAGDSGTASMSASMSSGGSDTATMRGFRREAIPAIDLAELMRSRLPRDAGDSESDSDAARPADGPAATLSFLKFDVEGAEFDLLPWLLLQGALCRVDYLLVECAPRRGSRTLPLCHAPLPAPMRAPLPCPAASPSACPAACPSACPCAHAWAGQRPSARRRMPTRGPLPHLCRWHLNRVPPSRRLAALSLRHSLLSLLEMGCARPPRAVLNNAFAPNNYQVPSPRPRRSPCDPATQPLLL